MKAVFNTQKELYTFRDKLLKGFPAPRIVFMGMTKIDNGDKFYIRWNDMDTNIKNYDLRDEKEETK